MLFDRPGWMPSDLEGLEIHRRSREDPIETGLLHPATTREEDSKA